MTKEATTNKYAHLIGKKVTPPRFPDGSFFKDVSMFDVEPVDVPATKTVDKPKASSSKKNPEPALFEDVPMFDL